MLILTIPKSDFSNGVNLDSFKNELISKDLKGQIESIDDHVTALEFNGEQDLNNRSDIEKIKEVVNAHTGATTQETFFIKDDTLSTTTNTSFQEKLKNTAMLLGGDYLIEWYCEARIDDSGAINNMQVQIDDVTIIAEPNIMADDLTWLPVHGFDKVTLGAGSHDIDLDFKTSASGKAAKVRRARIFVRKF